MQPEGLQFTRGVRTVHEAEKTGESDANCCAALSDSHVHGSREPTHVIVFTSLLLKHMRSLPFYLSPAQHLSLREHFNPSEVWVDGGLFLQEHYCLALGEDELAQLRLFCAQRKQKSLGQGVARLLPPKLEGHTCEKVGSMALPSLPLSLPLLYPLLFYFSRKGFEEFSREMFQGQCWGRGSQV